MKRSKRLRAKTKLKRHTPIRARNPKRKAKRFRRTFGSSLRADLISTEPCVVPGCGSREPSENHHWPTRGNGGTWRDVSPLCPHHHTGAEGFHFLGPETWAARFGVDLAETNARYARKFPVTDD